MSTDHHYEPVRNHIPFKICNYAVLKYEKESVEAPLCGDHWSVIPGKAY